MFRLVRWGVPVIGVAAVVLLPWGWWSWALAGFAAVDALGPAFRRRDRAAPPVIDVAGRPGRSAVVLAAGDELRAVIVLRQSMGLTVGQALALVRPLPATVLSGVDLDGAQELARRLRAAGATAEVVETV